MDEYHKRSIVDIRNLCVPIHACVTVTIGDVSIEKVTLLENNDFDFAPVLDESGKHILGLVETQYLRDLLNLKRPLSAKDPCLSNSEYFSEMSDPVSLDYLLDIFMNRKAVVIFSEMDAEEHGTILSVKGLLTISDLNKHPVRSTLYGLLSELESELAKLIQETFPDPWDWISKLSEEHQVTIIGYWELSKRRGVDIGPIEAIMLSQLIQIISKTKKLLELLGYRSRNEFDSGSGKIPELRNCVMHPVRPLILGYEDVATVYQTVRFVQDLIERLAQRGNEKP